MRTASDLNQALQSLQLQTRKTTEDIHAKDELKKHAEQENFNLNNEIKATEEEIRIEEQKVLKLRQSIVLKKGKISKNTEVINKVIQEVTRLRMEGTRYQSQLTEIEREYRTAMQSAGKSTSTSGMNGMKH